MYCTLVDVFIVIQPDTFKIIYSLTKFQTKNTPKMHYYAKNLTFSIDNDIENDRGMTTDYPIFAMIMGTEWL